MPPVNSSSPGKNWPPCRFSAAVNASPPYFSARSSSTPLSILRGSTSSKPLRLRFSQRPSRSPYNRQAQPAPPFEECHVKAREAPRYTTEEHRLAGRVVGGGEMADMVIDEIRRRQPETRAPRAGMKRRRDVEFEALRPHRVVVILAVEADHVLPHGEPLRLALDITSRRDRPVHQGAQHRNLVAELFDGKIRAP